MMLNLKQVKNVVLDFGRDSNAVITVQTALLFGAVILSLSVLAAPHLKNASDHYAENRALGLDQVTTGSVKRNKVYTIRKSVLD